MYVNKKRPKEAEGTTQNQRKETANHRLTITYDTHSAEVRLGICDAESQLRDAPLELCCEATSRRTERTRNHTDLTNTPRSLAERKIQMESRRFSETHTRTTYQVEQETTSTQQSTCSSKTQVVHAASTVPRRTHCSDARTNESPQHDSNQRGPRNYHFMCVENPFRFQAPRMKTKHARQHRLRTQDSLACNQSRRKELTLVKTSVSTAGAAATALRTCLVWRVLAGAAACATVCPTNDWRALKEGTKALPWATRPSVARATPNFIFALLFFLCLCLTKSG